MDSNYTLSDIAAVTDGGFGGGMGGSWLAWILIFALLGGGFGGWNNRGNCVTESDLCNANSFNELKSQVGRMNDQQAAIARQTDDGLCQIGYQGLQNTNAIQSQIASCCCDNLRAIDTVKFDLSNFASAIQMNDTANTQKVLDKLCQMELSQKDAVIAQQGQRIAALEADARMCGVLRWPTSATYAVGCNPFFGYGNGCCNGAY